jgi:large conductance mechanosensitive channel
MFSGFRDFLTRTNALALAIGVVIGVAIGAVVTSLVNDIIMPPIGWLLGGIDFASLRYVIGTDAQGAEVAIRYGLFINALISFVVVALVVYLIASRFIREEEPAETKACSFCQEPNAPTATRCRACTSTI